MTFSAKPKTAGIAFAIALIQSIWTFSGASAVSAITNQYAESSAGRGARPEYVPVTSVEHALMPWKGTR